MRSSYELVAAKQEFVKQGTEVVKKLVLRRKIRLFMKLSVTKICGLEKLTFARLATAQGGVAFFTRATKYHFLLFCLFTLCCITRWRTR